MAEERFVPLVALTDWTVETTKPPVRGLPIENISSRAGAILPMYHELSAAFRVQIAA